MSFGTPFCLKNEPHLQNLKALLNEAERMGVSHFDAVRSAQAVYDDIDGVVAYIPYVGLGTDVCSEGIVELQKAVERMQIVLRATPGSNLAIPRPDAAGPGSDSPLPTWVKVAGFGVLAVVALHYLSPLLGLATSKRRLSGYRRRSKR